MRALFPIACARPCASPAGKYATAGDRWSGVVGTHEGYNIQT